MDDAAIGQRVGGELRVSAAARSTYRLGSRGWVRIASRARRPSLAQGREGAELGRGGDMEVRVELCNDLARLEGRQ